MFSVAILVILISIGFVAGTKVLRSQANTKTRAEIKMIRSACIQYKDRYNSFPSLSETDIDINFGEFLSKVPPNSGFIGSRPMYIDYKRHNINYDSGTISDPYENPYQYKYDKDKNTILIWSIGLDESDPLDDVYN